MIDITKLTQKHIGRRVLYSNRGKSESGKITSFNDVFIFVRFDDMHQTSNGIACSPSNLRLIAEPLYKASDE